MNQENSPSPLILDGKETARKLLIRLENRVGFYEGRGITPRVTFIRVGEDPASISYVQLKEKMAKKVGIDSQIIVFPKNATFLEVKNQILDLNTNPDNHGILLQLPLPPHLNLENLISCIDPLKDVDGFHPENLGKLLRGTPGLYPCTPLGVLKLLKFYQIPLSGKKITVVGRSLLVGKPLANLLIQENATVTLCHSKTLKLEEFTRTSDLIVLAVGRPKMLNSEMILKGAIVIDVGVNRQADSSKKSGYRLVGDADYQDLLAKVSAITPVPGGVGPMTIATLLENTLTAVDLQKPELTFPDETLNDLWALYEKEVGPLHVKLANFNLDLKENYLKLSNLFRKSIRRETGPIVQADLGPL